MITTRISKIARLPREIRDQLGHRLENGEPGKDLVKWLGSLSKVQKILKTQFYGRPITEQNLSDWKQAGHLDWLRQQESLSLVTQFAEQSAELEAAADGRQISDRFATLIAVELTRLATTLLDQALDPQTRWQRLCEIHRELSRLRRDDHRAVLTAIQRDQWSRQIDREDEAAEKRLTEEYKAQLCAPLLALPQVGALAKGFGGGDLGYRLAASILGIQNGLPAGTLSAEPPAPPTPTGPTQPDPA